jgi:hypothetical protein
VFALMGQSSFEKGSERVYFQKETNKKNILYLLSFSSFFMIKKTTVLSQDIITTIENFL